VVFIESEWEGRKEREKVGFVFESGLGVVLGVV
jgi:hypothetical protein